MDEEMSLPKYTAGNANQTFRTELSGEFPSVIQRLKDKGSEMQEALVRVVEP